MPKVIKLPVMRETAMGEFMQERPTPASERLSRRPQVWPESNSEENQVEASESPNQYPHECPDCERTFSSPQGLAVHRARTHGVRGPSKKKKKRQTLPPMRPSMLLEDLLAELFPDGVPPTVEAITRVHDFIEAWNDLKELRR